MKKVILVIFALLLASTISFGQTLSFGPVGISTAESLADTVGNPEYVGVFDRPYNALLNVGIETQMYFKAQITAGAMTAPTWTIASAPSWSESAIDPIVNLDDSTQVAVFAPDLVGTYVIVFTDGELSDSLTINAGTYVGIEDGACGMCHQEKAAEWEQTGHYSIMEDQLNNAGGHYSLNCVVCHSTGYDAFADNQGFDDRTQRIAGVDSAWVFPAALGPGTWDNLVATYPNSMKLARIQCESCHGPGSAHYGRTADNKMVATLAEEACAVCHDDNHYHVYPAQWKESPHSRIPTYPGGTRTTCNGCHNGAQFVQFVEGETITTQSHINITCAVCHDPHSAENTFQLRTMTATLSNNQQVSGAGTGAICMNCHQSRADAEIDTNEPASHYGPHYAPQADMLLATNVATFGKTLPTSPHLEATGNSCATCHMYEEGAHGEHDADENLTSAGMHSFSMVTLDSVDNVASCKDCHGDVGDSFSKKKFFVNGNADHDGDGIAEGLQEEVHGLMDILGGLLPSADPHADVDETWTKTELKAAFNHRMVYYDHSYGIHNPAFTVALLKTSIQALKNNAIDGEIVAIEDVPNDQGKKVRIIWDKFVDDGIAIDPVAVYKVKRQDGEADWTDVGETTADGSNRYALVVPTVYDSTASGTALTNFMVVAVTQGGTRHESQPGAGYSVDNLVPMAPDGLVAELVGGTDVKLSWNDPVDEDFNYFAVYRGTAPGFAATDENRIATLTGTSYFDAETDQSQTYYYKISAFDFSGNQSELSDETSIAVTSVDSQNGAVPKAFALSQNYPNPFNPTTVIEFAVPTAAEVTINIYDIRGVHVRTLASGKFGTGYHKLVWDGRDNYGLTVSAGTYLYRMDSPGNTFTRKMIFIK